MRARGLLWTCLGGVLAFVVASGAWSLLRGAGTVESSVSPGALTGLEDYGGVPDFALTERSGQPVTRRDLDGRIWVADFIFTRCTGMCPILTSRMASLRALLDRHADASEVRLVSFSVDPGWDTPEVLSRYAAGRGADAGRWLFLTGDRETMHRLIGDGFRLSVAEAPEGTAADGELITHSDRLVLVDRKGRIRGYYHGTEEDSAERLVEDISRLLRAPAAPRG